jgi:phenylacetate-CoA ligase
MTDVPYYWKALDWDAFMAEYPPPPLFEQTISALSDDQVRAMQETRFLARVGDAWNMPFYQRHWGAAGLDRGSIRSIDDLKHIPVFTSDHLAAAIEDHPPYGDHHPLADSGSLARHLPLKLQTSGGTTGLPRTTMFDATAWEVQGIHHARALWAIGARPGDVIQITLTTSLANAGWSVCTGVHHWLGAIPVTTGSGVVTSSERQLELASVYGTVGWFGHGEYLGRLAEVAQATGFDLRSLPTKYIQALLGNDSSGELRRALEDAWGVPVYDMYGTHEIGLVGFECTEQNGHHVSDDTVILETVHVDDPMLAVAPGEVGNLVATSLHRSVPPIIRYDIKDAMAVRPRERCACGLVTSRLSGLTGRSDEMVKLRGQNVFPMACQDPVRQDARTNGQFLCVLTSDGEGISSRTELTVRVERRTRDIDPISLRNDLEIALKNALNVRVAVQVVDDGDLTQFTRLGAEGKIRRLLDLRHSK